MRAVLGAGVAVLLLFQVSVVLAEDPPSYSEAPPTTESDTEYHSYLDRLKEAFYGMAAGILFVCISFPLIFWVRSD